MKKLAVFISLLFFELTMIAQSINLSGTVTDHDDGTPIVGAVIMVKDKAGNTLSVATSDLRGEYSAKTSKTEAKSLELAILGYNSIRIPINGRTKIDVALEISSQLIEETVVTALGLTREVKAYDWASFMPAFRSAMREYAEELKTANHDTASNVLDFYIIGENTAKWGNDFIPCIYPEYIYADKKARYIERTEQNYITFCNVAKRNVGSQNLIFINSWNDFRYDSALEPATEYGDTYIRITKEEFCK